MKIAFIDDDRAYHVIVKHLLVDVPLSRGEKPHELVEFNEVSEFVDGDYDLVLTDLQMKETQGSETILAIQKKTSLPIIIMSGIGGDKRRALDGLKYLELGALDVWPKAETNDPNFANNLQEILEKGQTFKHAKVVVTRTVEVVDSGRGVYDELKNKIGEVKDATGT